MAYDRHVGFSLYIFVEKKNRSMRGLVNQLLKRVAMLFWSLQKFASVPVQSRSPVQHGELSPLWKCTEQIFWKRWGGGGDM